MRQLSRTVVISASLVHFSTSGLAEEFLRYNHILVIILENHAYDQIIGNPNAPTPNRLASRYGSATQFYAEVHPSEANYIAMIGGDTFGIRDDDAWYCRRGNPGRRLAYTKPMKNGERVKRWRRQAQSRASIR